MNEYDVVVVGGGAAGLSGALMLARSRRSVVVVDSGSPRNAPADGVHGLLGHDGIKPADLLARGRDEVRKYGGELRSGEVDLVTRGYDGFVVSVGGETLLARRLLVTTGVVDVLPEVAGLKQRWGRDVVHCPYCHGYEVRDRAIAILATGPMAMHQALLFRQLSADVMFFTHTTAGPDADEAKQLAARGIPVVSGEVVGVEVTDDRICGLRLADGQVVARDVVVVASRMVARAGFLEPLGLVPVPHPSGMGEYLPAEATGRTEVPGVWVAGNVTEMTAQVGASAAAGAMAGAQINADLVAEETREAVGTVGGAS